MNKFKRDLDEFVGESPRFKEPLKRKILSDMKKERRPANRFADFKYAAVLLLLLTVATAFLVLNMSGNNADPSGPAGSPDELPATILFPQNLCYNLRFLFLETGCSRLASAARQVKVGIQEQRCCHLQSCPI